MATHKSYAMTSGCGPDSYAKNSVSQRAVADFTTEVMKQEIVEKLDIGINPPKTLNIADLGCSIGPNTFSAVENIIQALESKYKKSQSDEKILEFQVFFNDQTSNDFNALFKSLPQNGRYYAAGVPGSFYSRIFPEASIHLAYSSISIHWLSQVPKEIIDKSSPAWNKGKVHYSDSGDEVIQAYKAQHSKDMEIFLKARAQEVVCGGLVVVLVLGIPQGIHHSEAGGNKTFSLIGSCLMDLVKKGVVNEEKVDSFNIPIYLMTPQEFEAAVKKNESFSLEKLEVLPHVAMPNATTLNANQLTLLMRSTCGELMLKEFGTEIVDELFDLFFEKVQDMPMSSFYEPGKTLCFLSVLKRTAC